jgi:uncharacterized protein YodC (DUF2158 family)
MWAVSDQASPEFVLCSFWKRQGPDRGKLEVQRPSSPQSVQARMHLRTLQKEGSYSCDWWYPGFSCLDHRGGKPGPYPQPASAVASTRLFCLYTHILCSLCANCAERLFLWPVWLSPLLPLPESEVCATQPPPSYATLAQ